MNHPSISINPSRVDINYESDDGVIYVRPGVTDISMGDSNYSQVRILIGDNHFIKGVAMYKEDLPTGIDLQFNTGKKDTGNKFDAFNLIKGETQ